MKLVDQDYLKGKQYKTAENLLARINLHKHFSTNPYIWQRWVFDQLNISPRMSILEIGCGPGHLWLENVDRLPMDSQIMLSDFSVGMVSKARENLNHSSGVSFINFDVQNNPFNSGQFNIVIANHMLYHVPDIPKGLSEISRVLKPEGLFCAATNGYNHMRELYELIFRFYDQISMEERIAGQRFALENGESQLRQFFNSVVLKVYQDNLIVTETKPLIDYLKSMAFLDLRNQSPLEDLERYVRGIIKKRGKFVISKSGGVFICTGVR